MNETEFELRQQLLTEFIDLQLNPLPYIQCNYGQTQDCVVDHHNSQGGSCLDKMRTWQVEMKIPHCNSRRSYDEFDDNGNSYGEAGTGAY